MNVNSSISHPSAFISSTFIDLKDDRKKVADVLNKRGVLVNALDEQPASNKKAKDRILNGIEQSDFVILIIGDRYGSILEAMTGSPWMSITYWEYLEAKRLGKTILPYIKENNDSNPLPHDDKNNKDYIKKRKYFSRFKHDVSESHTPSYYLSPEELADEIDKSLIRFYREGVLDLLSDKSRLNKEISQLRNEKESLLKHTQSAIDLAYKAIQENRNSLEKNESTGLMESKPFDLSMGNLGKMDLKNISLTKKGLQPMNLNFGQNLDLKK